MKTPSDRFRSRQIIFDRRARRLEQARERAEQLRRVDRFVREVVAPWATQARVAQLTAADFDEMRADRDIGVKARKVSFGRFVSAGNSPGVGHARFVYLTPSRAKSSRGDGNRVIHRGLVEAEFFRGQPAARMYVTVFGEAKVDRGRTEYKDVQQDPGGAIRIYTGGSDSAPLWVNAGWPLRALAWLEKYRVQSPQARPLVRSFLLPIGDYLKLSRGVVLEHDARRRPGRSFNVDRHYAPNQFAVRGGDLQLLRNKAIPGSLVTYAENLQAVTRRTAGKVEPVSALRARVGVPSTMLPGVWVDPRRGEFAKKDQFEPMADRLMNLYGTWTGNDQFLSDAWKRIPRQRRLQMMREHLMEYRVGIPDEYWQPMVNGKVPAAVAASLRPGP